MPPLSRGQIALRVGEGIRQLGISLLKEPEDSEVRQLRVEKFHSCIVALDSLINSCREAKSMYASAPKIRQAILDGGEQISIIRGQVDNLLISFLEGTVEYPDLGRRLLALGQAVKLIDFLPPLPKEELQA